MSAAMVARHRAARRALRGWSPETIYAPSRGMLVDTGRPRTIIAAASDGGGVVGYTEPAAPLISRDGGETWEGA